MPVYTFFTYFYLTCWDNFTISGVDTTSKLRANTFSKITILRLSEMGSN
jgi:hypothetical protein